MSKKGSQFERDICYDLSRWWSGKRKKLLFWRTANSGGAATVRGRKGISSKSHSGDTCVIDKSARVFGELFTLELKRGYSKKKQSQDATIHALLDRTSQKDLYVEWIKQAQKAAKRAGTPFWLLIHQRDRRRAMIYFPSALYGHLWTVGAIERIPTPLLSLHIQIEDQAISLMGMELRMFLWMVDPSHVYQLHNRFCGGKHERHEGKRNKDRVRRRPS